MKVFSSDAAWLRKTRDACTRLAAIRCAYQMQANSVKKPKPDPGMRQNPERMTKFNKIVRESLRNPFLAPLIEESARRVNPGSLKVRKVCQKGPQKWSRKGAKRITPRLEGPAGFLRLTLLGPNSRWFREKLNTLFQNSEKGSQNWSRK